MDRNKSPAPSGRNQSLAQAEGKRFERTRAALKAFERETRNNNTELAYARGLRYFWAWAWLMEDKYPEKKTEDDAENGLEGPPRPHYPVETKKIEQFVADDLLGMEPDVERQMLEMGIKKRPGPSKLSAVRQRLWALGRAHAEALGEEYAAYVHTYVVKKILKRAAKQPAHRTEHPDALRIEDINAILAALNEAPSPRHLVLSAIVATAFAAGGLRRSELCALQVDDVRKVTAPEAPGFRFELRINQSKTRDAADEPEIQPVRGAAAVYLARWMDFCAERGLDDGPLFRAVRPDGGISQKGMSPSWLHRMLKYAANLAGLDAERISPHSLRFGYVTSAHDMGVPLKEAMAMSRHRSVAVHLQYKEVASKMQGPGGNLLKYEQS